MSAINKREYIALPLDLCYFDRARYDKLYADLPTEIVSYRKYENGLMRILFSTKEELKGKEISERQHLLWIQLLEIKGKQYVKYCCDCKYFEFRQLRIAKRLFDFQEIENDLVVIIDSKSYSNNKNLFNIDKHAFLALKERFKIQIQISI
ncbi:MAG TPA: hypothetical protein VMX55_14955 [candidate division Zixibacteria bacterium]|nr:hypothetical protein [candidate division Zixibacteria bacterium]